ncbi:MAG: transcriptional regulator NrdR [Acidobacteria bacterium]|nr:MAG: transcriptional regulator NrdR [Acidobacteriota bacterium]
MKCPYCDRVKDKVVDSREARDGAVIRRRRECLLCGRRFTSYERIEEVPYMVVKKDGEREIFSPEKLRAGLLKAVHKRPVAPKQVENIVEEVETLLQEITDREIETRAIGELVMERLRELDKVAYVRFASVYRKFEDIDEFMNELKGLIDTRK